MIYRTTPSGVLVPNVPTQWPRPAGWDKLPADIRAQWDARWLTAAKQ
jgi:hypothetical protein